MSAIPRVQRFVSTLQLVDSTCLRQSTTKTLPIPAKSSTIPVLLKPFSLTQTRHESTLRRQRKAMNIPPLPSVGGPPPLPTGGSGRSHRPRSLPDQVGDTIVYNPPSSAPNVYHTPPVFLPPSDPRRRLFDRQRLAAAANASSHAGESATQFPPSPFTMPSTTNLPPRMRPHLPAPGPKRYHLQPAQIEEMRALRAQDENTWTRAKLAEKFECSIFFVQQVCQASNERRRSLAKRQEQIKTYVWGGKRRAARRMRVRRRELWGRDE